MTLEFEKLIPQIERMGRFVAHRTEDISQRGERALEQLANATDLEEIWRKIELARTNDAGYRGAAPFEGHINDTHTPNTAPERATVVAADGSQVYPDAHGSALYYLTNMGLFIFHHGTDELPEQFSDPQLFYSDADLRDKQGQVIKNAAVNARRTVQEIQALSYMCWQYREVPVPMIGLMDGPLLWWAGTDVPHWQKLEDDYRGALIHMHDTHTFMQMRFGQRASLAGYVDRHDSRFVVRLLQLLITPDDEIRRSVLDTLGPYEGLTDDFVFANVLQPRERSAVMIQQSPQNKSYKHDTGDSYEIAFFYLNVGAVNAPHIVRVEIPMWVAKSADSIHDVHSLLLEQCLITGSYPYVLTRADELAVVKGHEKQQLTELVNIELLRNRQQVEKSPKQIGKDQARGSRRRYGQPSY